jgi:hypothetical protein
MNPEEEYKMSPEMLEITTTYLECADIDTTAEMLGIDRFVDTVFLDQGYLNRHKLQAAFTKIIDLKLEELDDAEMGSNKDIADLLMMMHKIGTDTRKEIAEASKPSAPTNQTNVQFNNGQFGDNYNSLLGKLMDDK